MSILSSSALPPKDVVDKIERLIAQLGSDVFADRQKASDELLGIGEAALPLLKRRLEDRDPGDSPAGQGDHRQDRRPWDRTNAQPQRLRRSRDS